LLVPLAVATGALFLFGLPPIGMPMIAAIVARLHYAGSPGWALATAALTAAGTAVYGLFVVSGQPTVQSAAAVTATGLAPGIMAAGTALALWWAVLTIVKRPAWQVFSGVTAVSYASYVLAWFAGAAAQGATLSELISAQVGAAIEQMGPLLDVGAAGVSVAEVEAVVRTMLVQSWLGTSLISIMLGAGLTTMLVSRLARAHGIPTQGPRALASFDITWHVVWPLAAGFGIVAWMLRQDAQETVLAGIGLNLLVVSGAVVLAQGFAVAESLLKRIRLGVIPRALVYGLLLWLWILPPVLFGLGAADLWVNFRKLPRGPRQTQQQDDAVAEGTDLPPAEEDEGADGEAPDEDDQGPSALG
jgi:hypothetical protein